MAGTRPRAQNWTYLTGTGTTITNVATNAGFTQAYYDQVVNQLKVQFNPIYWREEPKKRHVPTTHEVW